MNVLSISARFFTVTCLLTTAAGCGSQNDILSNQIPASGARIKLINAVSDGPSVDVFANDAKLNGTSLAFGSSFPTEYAVVPATGLTLKVTAPASGTVAAQTLLTAPVPLETDKYYTIAAAGTVTAPVAVLVPDDLSVPDPSKNYVRVLNLVSNAPALDVAIGTAAPIIANVAYKAVSNYVAVDPNASSAPYVFQMRETGKTSVLGTTLSFNSNLTQGRKYTLVLRGLTGRTGTQGPAFLQVTNK